jgi:hypothetical protein
VVRLPMDLPMTGPRIPGKTTVPPVSTMRQLLSTLSFVMPQMGWKLLPMPGMGLLLWRMDTKEPSQKLWTEPDEMVLNPESLSDEAASPVSILMKEEMPVPKMVWVPVSQMVVLVVVSWRMRLSQMEILSMPSSSLRGLSSVAGWWSLWTQL